MAGGACVVDPWVVLVAGCCVGQQVGCATLRGDVASPECLRRKGVPWGYGMLTVWSVVGAGDGGPAAAGGTMGSGAGGAGGVEQEAGGSRRGHKGPVLHVDGWMRQFFSRPVRACWAISCHNAEAVKY